jgi:hypothetical protein
MRATLDHFSIWWLLERDMMYLTQLIPSDQCRPHLESLPDELIALSLV